MSASTPVVHQRVIEFDVHAHDSPYGLAAYVQSAVLARARRVARRLRAGNVQINYPPVDRGAPFDGFKQSGKAANGASTE